MGSTSFAFGAALAAVLSLGSMGIYADVGTSLVQDQKDSNVTALAQVCELKAEAGGWKPEKGRCIQEARERLGMN
jgi:hypothetical protein